MNYSHKLSMRAKINGEVLNGKNYGGDKELVSAYTVLGKVKGELREVVVVRCYMGRSRNAGTVYASVWVHGDKHCAGHGSAGGYGYHKESAAIGSAISDAGIELYGSPCQNGAEKVDFKQRAHIDGCGNSAAREAMLAVARAAGARGALFVVSH